MLFAYFLQTMKIANKIILIFGTALFVGLPSWRYLTSNNAAENNPDSQLRRIGRELQTESTISILLSPQEEEMAEMTTEMSTLDENTTSKPSPPPVIPNREVRIRAAKAITLQTRRALIRSSLLRHANDSWLIDHIPEVGVKKPLRNVIISTWRSGSTFVGELISSHPGTFHIFEPFLYMGTVRVEDENVAKAIKMAKSLFNCSFDYPEWTNQNGLYMSGILSRSKPLEKLCTALPGACMDAKFISQLCNLFPIQFTKFVRLRLRDAEELLDDDRYDTRLLYLVRDPRGTMKSRNTGSKYWCDLNPACFDEERLCEDLVDDYEAAEELRDKYPDRFMTLRYEDVALNVPKAAEDILKFFRLRYHPRVEQYVRLHSTSEGEADEFGTFHKSREVAFNWLKYYFNDEKDVKKKEMLRSIQKACGKAMKMWGYKSVDV